MKITSARHSSRQLVAILASLLATVIAPIAAQSTRTTEQEIEALVLEYTRLEDARDMATQSRMIAPDRWWHGIGGRRTDNAVWMKVQQEGFDATVKRYPGLHTIREVRDLRIKVVAPNVAIASFTWFPNRVIPGDLPADKVQALGPAPIPSVLSMVWVRQSDGWKLTSSHISPEYLR